MLSGLAIDIVAKSGMSSYALHTNWVVTR